jgi:hypothetical protein
VHETAVFNGPVEGVEIDIVGLLQGHVDAVAGVVPAQPDTEIHIGWVMRHQGAQIKLVKVEEGQGGLAEHVEPVVDVAVVQVDAC